MKKRISMCAVIFVFVLAACGLGPFALSSGKLTVQEAKGYNGGSSYIAVTAKSKHYKKSSTSSGFLYDGAIGSNGNGNKLLNPGETVNYKIEVGNYGSVTEWNINVVISTDDNYVFDMLNASGSIGSLFGRDDYSVTKKTIFSSSWDKNLTFTISPSTPPGHIVRFEIVFSDTDGNSWRDYFLITVY